ncbi:hypothetical protein FRB99_007122 [Tulasnella sp. 403]|nr:hypothetical protein FRB99_007122 [Tulasnella sp. 403]
MATNVSQLPPSQRSIPDTIDLTNDDDPPSDIGDDSDSGSDDGQNGRAAKRQKTSGMSSASATASATSLTSNGSAASGGTFGAGSGFATTTANGGAYRTPQVLTQPPITPNFTRPLGPPLMQPAGQWTHPAFSPQAQAAGGVARFPYPPTPGSNGSTSTTAASTSYFPPRPSTSATLTTQNLPPTFGATSTASTNGDAKPQHQVIDLTNSNTPSPPVAASTNSTASSDPTKRKDARKDVMCIGELTVTALVLYPIDYLCSTPATVPREEYVPVRLIYDSPAKRKGRVNEETIRITAPVFKGANGENMGGEDFGVVEQRVANVLGPLMAKVLIRVSATIRRAARNGNVPAVSQFLQNASLFLDHPSIPYDPSQHRDSPEYHNPHNPPAGGFRSAMASAGGASGSRWSQQAVAGKSVEVQRSQVDEVFNSLRSGEDLPETEPGPNIATNLYPHQKKALTFLLERELEREAPPGKSSSLWQPRKDPSGRVRAWYNVVTTKEVRQQPQECKGAILADDMGLGKTITVVSLLANTLASASAYVGTVPIRAPAPAPPPKPVVRESAPLTAAHFAGSVWGMPDVSDDEDEEMKARSTAAPTPIPTAGLSAKAKSKLKAAEQKTAEELSRAARIKTKSRATLIVCPLSTVVNWEDQFKEHWAGEVVIVGGATGLPIAPSQPSSSLANSVPGGGSWSGSGSLSRGFPSSGQIAAGGKTGTNPLRVYVYHGTSRRPDPNYLADFDAVITTYSTLASEYSRQSKSLAAAAGGMAGKAVKAEEDEDEDMEDDDDDDDDGGSSEGVAEVDPYGREIPREKKKKILKRKKPVGSASGSGVATPVNEMSSPLQMVNWFRVVLDEAHSIKETSTIGSRACCDLVADRRLCLTGTPVQNKLDDVYALIKFLRFEPFDDKSIWTEYIGGPAKFGQPLGVARLQTIMKSITLRRTKETKAADGKTILNLPPRRDELRYLKFDEHERRIYDSFFDESKAEFTQLSKNNEVMKNYVGILQKILRLRQICDHWELVQGKGPGLYNEDATLSYDEITAAVAKEGLNLSRATAVFALLRESGTAQCVDCGMDLATPIGTALEGCEQEEIPKPSKRGRKPKNGLSRGPTRQNSPSGSLRPVLTQCLHLFCVECFRHSTCPDWPNIHPDLRRACSACQTILTPMADAVEVSPDGLLNSDRNKPARKREKRSKDNAFLPSTKVKALLGDLMPFSRSNPYSTNYDPNSVEITMCDAQGNELDDGPVKTVVLNPAVENQAVDRIHRLGQKNAVTTIKFVMEDSIETRLLEVQKRKTQLANMTLGQTLSKADIQQRRLEELNQLFGEGPMEA